MDNVFIKLGHSMSKALNVLEITLESPDVARPIKARKILRRLEAKLKAQEEKRKVEAAKQERERLMQQQWLLSMGAIAVNNPITFNWKEEGF